MTGDACQLRRGPIARLRPQGIAEITSYLGLIVLTFGLEQLGGGPEPSLGGPAGVAATLVAGASCLAIRVAVFVEFAEVDPAGVRWRSLFRRRFIPWAQIAEIELGRMLLLPSYLPTRVVQLRVVGRRRPTRIRPSALCGLEATSQWVLAALTIRPPSDVDGLSPQTGQ